MAGKTNKLVEGTVKELLENLGIDASFQVSENEEGIGVILETDESGMIIGRHGDTLDSLQLILSLILAKKLGEFKRVTLEVGDYKKNREDYLKNLALDTKDKVISENREIFLPSLKPWERRIVHLELQDDKEVISESVGEGRDRVLVVKPKN